MPRKVRRFEDLIAWERSMDLAVTTYEAAAKGHLSRSFALRNQIERAASSVPANIAEGFEHGSRAEFHRFLTIAKASCGELRSHLHLAERLGLLTAKDATEKRELAEEVSRIISGLRTSVARQKATPRPS
jgi:four helix bundle protein